MKDLANFLGPFAQLHTLCPVSIISAASVGGLGGHLRYVVLFNNSDLLAVTEGFYHL